MRQATDAALVVIAHVDATVWLVALWSPVATSVCVAYMVHVCRRCCRSSPPISKYTRAAERSQQAQPTDPRMRRRTHPARLPRSRHRHSPYRLAPPQPVGVRNIHNRCGVPQWPNGIQSSVLLFFCFLRPAGRCVQRAFKGLWRVQRLHGIEDLIDEAGNKIVRTVHTRALRRTRTGTRTHARARAHAHAHVCGRVWALTADAQVIELTVRRGKHLMESEQKKVDLPPGHAEQQTPHNRRRNCDHCNMQLSDHCNMLQQRSRAAPRGPRLHIAACGFHRALRTQAACNAHCTEHRARQTSKQTSVGRHLSAADSCACDATGQGRRLCCVRPPRPAPSCCIALCVAHSRVRTCCGLPSVP